MTDDRPRYMISVAAELVGMHPQTLRMYEQMGLVRPKRTAGNTRLYSEAEPLGHGERFARVKLTVPKNLTEREREAIEALQEASRENPREGLVW